MKLIESSYEIIPQESGLEGIYKQIEKAGRLCYKSEDKICDGSAEKMVKFLMGRHHGSPLEHGTVYLKGKLELDEYGNPFSEWCPLCKYEHNPYSKYYNDGECVYVTTNFRVLFENDWLSDLDKYLCEPTDYHEKRYSVKITCSRSISHEFVRHRVMSFCQESQRYCNYSLGKFGGEITYVIPEWIKIYMNDLSDNDFEKTSNELVIKWKKAIQDTEITYLDLLDSGVKPQDARSVLPNDCKTELIITGFASDWKHFFELRVSPTAHPDARAIACPMRAEFLLEKYI